MSYVVSPGNKAAEISSTSGKHRMNNCRVKLCQDSNIFALGPFGLYLLRSRQNLQEDPHKRNSLRVRSV